jgi:repressor LexA
MGYIKRDREVSRAIEVTHGGTKRARVVSVPIIGAIAAGQPISVPAADTWHSVAEDTIDVSADMLRNREEVFGLKVKGTSMIDALVNDGDVVILEPTSTARDGEMVAAWIEDEQTTTLKKWYLEGDRVRLQPANSTMDPIYKDARNVEVQGRVIAAFRPMN